jgi:hypothetical protein
MTAQPHRRYAIQGLYPICAGVEPRFAGWSDWLEVPDGQHHSVGAAQLHVEQLIRRAIEAGGEYARFRIVDTDNYSLEHDCPH